MTLLPANITPSGAEPRQDADMLDVRISVQAVPGTLAAWLDLARTLESAGFDALLVGDHPGDGDPLVALAATTTLSLSTYVIRLGVREPHHVADAAATLDRFAPGRVILGVGAGHTPAEWSALGRERPGPRERVQRLMESVEAVAQLLAGERMTARGAQIDMRDAEVIRPDRAPGPSHRRRTAGRHRGPVWSRPHAARRASAYGALVPSRPDPPARHRPAGRRAH